MSKPRIVAIGDSLTQGFMSGAIQRTDLSWPAQVARAMGLEVPLEFRVPRFPAAGLPLNIEDFLRWSKHMLGPDLSTTDWIARMPMLASAYIDTVEDVYERGAGAAPGKFGGVYHNLAVWGFTVLDALETTPTLCKTMIGRAEGWIDDDFLGLPSEPMYRTARRVIDPRHDPARAQWTVIDCLEHLVKTEGVDVLFLWLGANDALRTVLTLRLDDMDGTPATNVPLDRYQFTLTSAVAFDQDYIRLGNAIQSALSKGPTAPKVFVGTVPHVTIPPVTTGIGSFQNGYFERYGRFYADDQNFNRVTGRCLTRQEAQKIDQRIDSFNASIRAVAGNHQWVVVDTCAMLDRLAIRRHEQNPEQALRTYYAEHRPPIPDHPLLHLKPVPSILKLKTTERGRRIGGGLMSLDCVHPSTIGYAMVAEAFLEAMADASVPGADPRRIEWDWVFSQDSLLRSPPPLWDDVLEAATANSTLWDVLFRVLGG